MAKLCVIDTETTGLGKFDRSNPERKDYPISIGAVIVDIYNHDKSIQYVDGMKSLIRIPCPSKARDTMLIHGIMPEDLENAPKPAEVCKALTGLITRHDITYAAAWNYKFDRHFVDLLFDMAHMRPPSLKWGEMMPERYSSLEKYVSKYARDERIRSLEAHDAFNDCIRALEVYAVLHGYSFYPPQLDEMSTCFTAYTPGIIGEAMTCQH